MKVYIDGKITGDRRYRAKFREAAKTLEEAGHVVLNPATLPDGLDDADYMRICMAMADELATAMYAKEVYLTWVLNLQGYMVQLATGEHDTVKCQECGHVFRAGWMEGRCPYCEAQQAATRYVENMREEARE
ncbi:DUF4406 domain-containing protein [Pseudoflavonifractor phocaeensis]|uniref:DUF4406 domain-containing protein n=1 Tax=Pseudoflavonifractor phocaeensis TaxID=1870988 RepID=UPI0019560792|nr:DUF4406 domain-containing protein [Pseudoflavonifractor phocaeensis]MBM6724335.1 DUF4406 domain-containing protein [Pseudoflavonifractor phocaeensis]